ncbi:uncharacterized protein LOC130729190 [Lotus japonicus]|uniref:uncharacterized protein LOC130729190 n=1 Tax=Lotus japonicus TaxID=34305 RepID=UPI0025899DB2|nr:uncharacterized protein LOC130729190 [Lotus japonicus]
MKSIFAVFAVFSILLIANCSCATRDLGDYWKNMMKGQAMPEAIKELVQDPQASYAGKDRFIRDFDIRPNVILYHTHVGSSTKQKQNTFAKN